jgi:hypothetical protein
MPDPVPPQGSRKKVHTLCRVDVMPIQVLRKRQLGNAYGANTVPPFQRLHLLAQCFSSFVLYVSRESVIRTQVLMRHGSGLFGQTWCFSTAGLVLPRTGD